MNEVPHRGHSSGSSLYGIRSPQTEHFLSYPGPISFGVGGGIFDQRCFTSFAYMSTRLA